MLRNKLSYLGAMLLSFLGAQAQTSMSLDECIIYALEHHRSVKNAMLDQEKSEHEIAQTRASGLPQIDGTISFINNVKVQSQFLPANAFDPTADPNKTTPLAFGVAQTGNASITLNQMLFNGSYFVGLKAAETYSLLSTQNKAVTEEEVKVNVTKAYYGVIVNQSRKDLVLANKDQIEKLQSDMKILVEQGMAEKIELSKLTVSLNNLLTELEKIETLDKISMNLLKMNMGMSFTEELNTSQRLEDILVTMADSTIPELNITERKEYKVLETQLILADLNIKNYKMNALPSAGLFGTVGANNGTLEFSELPKFGDWRTYGYWGAQVNVPIFSSFRNKSLIMREQVNKEMLQNNIEMASQGYEFEYLQKLDTYKNFQFSLERQKENMQLAQEIFENAKIKYQNGVGSNYDIIVAETSLKQAQSSYLASVYDLLVTKIELEKASGNLN